MAPMIYPNLTRLGVP